MAEYAAKARVSVETTRKWRRSGYGPRGVRIGGQVRYRTADVLAFLGSGQAPQQPQPAPPGRPTVDEIRSWPAVVPVAQACSALAISESYGYQLARESRFPAKTITVGTRIRVLTRSVLDLLGEAPA